MKADPVTTCLALYAADQLGKAKPDTLEQWATKLPNKAPLIKWYENKGKARGAA